MYAAYTYCSEKNEEIIQCQFAEYNRLHDLAGDEEQHKSSRKGISCYFNDAGLVFMQSIRM